MVNKIRGLFTSVAVKAPGFGDRRKAMLEDIAVLTGAQVVAPEVGLKLDQVGLEVLGTARRVVVTKDDTTIIDGGGERQARSPTASRQIRAEIERTDSDWDREKLQERLAKLAGGVCVIKVGAAHRGRAQGEEAPHRGRRLGDPRRHRGGHRRRRRLRPRPRRRRLSTATSGSTATRPPASSIVRGARREPLRWIAENAGLEGYVVVAKVATLAGRPRPQRRDRRVRRPGRGRRHRPGQGHPLGAAATRRRSRRMLLTTETLVVEKPDEPRTTHGRATATRTARAATAH